MDRRQKSTLRSQHIRIADELILDEDFYAALRRDKIFTNGMLDLIKAENKPRDRVYKMLELLEKRGPKAFENFVWILKENYEWLAKELEDQYAKRLESSQQERELHEQRYTRYETTAKYFDQYEYNREERLCNNSNRAVSTPPHRRKARQTIQIHESVSAGYNTKDSQQFFPKASYNDTMTQQSQMKQMFQDIGLDNTDTSAVGVTMQLCDEADSSPQQKQYKDACMSPIGIIESQRNIISESNQLKCDKDETESYVQGFDEIQSQTATVSTSNIDDAESTVTQTTEVDSEGLNDNVDGPEDVNVAVDDCEEDFPTSEVYYDCVRRGSSRFSQFDDAFHTELDIKDEENDRSRSEISYEHSEAYQIQMDAMRNMYQKIVEINFENEEVEGIDDDNDITWDMIECEIDRLIDRLENSDDMKMIRKCLSLFTEKERRQPLNTCIENLQGDKKQLESKLKDKQKEIDQMVFDLWKHQQDMSNLKKLQKRLSEQDIELNNYKTSLENLEKDAEIKLKQISEKDLKIETLEGRLKDLQGDQQRKPGIQMRRGTTTQRRTSNAQGQSPRRQPNNCGDPRFSLMQSGYGNSTQSPRNVSTAMRRAPSNRR